MKTKLILFFAVVFVNELGGQPSFSTRIAFRLYDESNNLVNEDQFHEHYIIANAFGNVIDTAFLAHYVHYDPKTNYFFFYITTVPPRFSFAIYYKNKTMTLFIPFFRDRKSQKKYAIDIKVIEGDFLLSFNTKNAESLLLNSNIPYYRIENINWKRQHRKFKKSGYFGDETIYRNRK